MIKIKNFTKNTLNSFILLPLLLTNAMNPGIINSQQNSIIPDSIGENLSLNLQIFKDDTVESTPDLRAAKIDAYFSQWDLPLAGYGKAMVAAADKYGIDWKILPAIAMLETTGGKNLCDNTRNGVVNKNSFGFGGCSIYFATFEDAFDAVAKTISGNGEKTADLYKGKSVEEILEVYNPKDTPGITKNYHGKAVKVMSDIESMEVQTEFLAKA